MTLPAGMDEVGAGIYSIDTMYLRPGLAASHLLVDEGVAAFVDTGTNSSVPDLLGGLDATGLGPADVRFVFLTHIHLDHAGGAGRLMQSLPDALCIVHPRGSRHMIDPARLMAGTRAVYGDKLTAELYGEIEPIDSERVVAPDDGETFTLGSRRLNILYTEGHARHHYCLHDEKTASVFTGDSFGISYRALDTAKGPFVFPTTTPIHFDPEAAHAAMERIRDRDPERLFLTHYSRVDDIERLAGDMHESLDGFTRIALGCRETADPEAAMRAELFDYLALRIEAHGFAGDRNAIGAIIDADVALNAQGLAVWLAGLDNAEKAQQ